MTALAPLSGSRIITSWQLDIPTLALIVVLAGLYVSGVWRLRARGERWPPWRSACFIVLGLGSVALVMMSSLGVYDRTLFWPRAVQYTVLISLAPLLLAVGEPLELLRRTLSAGGRRRLDRLLRGRLLRIILFPLVGAILGVVVLMIVYLTPVYRASLTSETAHHLVCLLLLVTGCVFFIPELDQGDDLLPQWCGYSMRAVFSLIDGLLDAVPGVVIMTMHGTIAAGFYTSLHRGWGPSLHWDQTIGGGLMFTLSEAVALPFLLVLFLRWVRDDERSGREADARLDLDLELDARAAGAGSITDLSSASTRPWWETDPGPLAGRQGFRDAHDHPQP